MKELIEKIVERLENAKYLGNYTEAIWQRSGICTAIDIIHEEAKAYNESVKTNADYIRNMTDEELINIIPCQYGGCDNDYRNCDRCKLIWLKSEREG